MAVGTDNGQIGQPGLALEYCFRQGNRVVAFGKSPSQLAVKREKVEATPLTGESACFAHHRVNLGRYSRAVPFAYSMLAGKQESFREDIFILHYFKKISDIWGA